MTEELALRDDPLSVEEIKAHVRLIQQVMKEVMIEGVHYGTIPGCGPKPTLLKPGAEKLCSTFRLAPEILVDDISSGNDASYRVTVRMKNMAGDFLGAGVGECSSNEDKYKWKKAFNNKEWEETPEDQRREKWRTYKGKEYKAKQILTNPADEANTVLKMAKKRALVDGVLTCTAASDIFEQDKEDFDQNGDKQQGKPKVKNPQSKSKKKPPGEEETVTPETVSDVFTQDEPVSDEEFRGRISAMLLNMCNSKLDEIPVMLKEYTTFQGDKGEVFRTDVDKLTGKYLQSTYGKIKKDWKAAGFGQDTKQEIENEKEPGSDG
jgi:hypothetical protein